MGSVSSVYNAEGPYTHRGCSPHSAGSCGITTWQVTSVWWETRVHYLAPARLASVHFKSNSSSHVVTTMVTVAVTVCRSSLLVCVILWGKGDQGVESESSVTRSGSALLSASWRNWCSLRILQWGPLQESWWWPLKGRWIANPP